MCVSESIVVCVIEFELTGSLFDSSVPDWLTEEAVASGVQNTALSFHSGISSDSVMMRSHQKMMCIFK